MENLHPDQDVKCPNCKFIAISKMSMAIHTSIKHPRFNEDQKYLCSICNTPCISERTVRVHITFEHFKTDPVVCPVCSKEFKIHYLLKKHMRTFHADESQATFLCDQCELKFTTGSLLYRHKRYAHSGKHTCKDCGKVLGSLPSYHNHLKTHIINKAMCDECGKEFKNEHLLKLHRLRHLEVDIPNAFKCDIEGCDKAFGKARSLKDHIKNSHVGKVRKHKCDYCPMMFHCPSNKKEHINTIHLNKKDFKCDQCDFATARRGQLRVHIKSIHDGLLFSCDYPGCSKSYNLKGNLDAHKQRVHKIKRPLQKSEVAL